MTSPPLTDRQYAYFHVSGPSTHEEVTALLGMKPSEVWNVGDINPRNGKPRNFMSWRLSSGLDDKHRLEEHIDALFLYLGTKVEQLRKLWLEYELTIQCVGYFPGPGHGAHFTRECIRQAAILGIALDLDFYYVDDNDHEI